MPCHRTSPGRTMGKRPLWVMTYKTHSEHYESALLLKADV
jgi:hypothetical protein